MDSIQQEISDENSAWEARFLYDVKERQTGNRSLHSSVYNAMHILKGMDKMRGFRVRTIIIPESYTVSMIRSTTIGEDNSYLIAKKGTSAHVLTGRFEFSA